MATTSLLKQRETLEQDLHVCEVVYIRGGSTHSEVPASLALVILVCQIQLGL